MTRKTLYSRLRSVFLVTAIILVIAAVAKFSGIAALRGVYDYINDMALVVFPVVAAYMATIFQKRSSFLQSLREEWREIVDTKSRLIAYCEQQDASAADYVEVYRLLSRSIDYMRIVYSNVGETRNLIGLYPYEPLHDMRRAFEAIDPRSGGQVTRQQSLEACEAIWEAFRSLRESFLNEFDLAEPASPILIPGSRRTKSPGARGVKV
ncbi:hypothetical protein MnTg02_03103 [bacterium MnTg02]|nr:hypothetical protein MnTg02_03103 [bacterium MnTg02]